MSTTYSQTTRPLRLSTPLGPNVLLPVGMTAYESLSEPFQVDLELWAKNSEPIAFEKLLGRMVSVTLKVDGGQERFLTGIVGELSEAGRDDTFTHYGMRLVPEFWLLSRRLDSRIFQYKSVPDILRQVLRGLEVSLELHGKYQPRDYCVQYHETDFNFASRLMEDEGLFYFFRHSATRHTMVISDSPQSHRDLPGQSTLPFDKIEGGLRDEYRVHAWRKKQEIRPGRCTLRDYSFELPDHDLEARRAPAEAAVSVGSVVHRLDAGRNDRLEVYEYPGGYAHRFDGVDSGGGDQAADLARVFDDSVRTAAIRMQQESVTGLVIQGRSNCGHILPGYRFHLLGHHNGDGAYVLTGVTHRATYTGAYRTGGGEFAYSNEFTCLPASFQYRPRRVTPRPTVRGTQTAVVVGPPGEEIFTDKYGRVKVHFPWDRAGPRSGDSSCWIRVSQVHAGKRFGGLDLPRVGEEVIVDFLEGDPDRPIIIGRVYNAGNMPPVDLPKAKTTSGLKSRTYPGGGGFNQITMDDSKGKELLFVNAQHDNAVNVGNNRSTQVGVDSTEKVGNNLQLTIGNNTQETVGNDRVLSIGSNNTESVGANETKSVAANQSTSVGANQANTVGGSRSNLVGSSQTEAIGMIRSANVGLIDTTLAGLIETIHGGLMVSVSAGLTLVLSGPGGTITIDSSGIHLKGKQVVIEGDTVHINP